MKSRQTQKFKKTQLGLFPKDWSIVRFSDILSKDLRHGTYKSKKYTDSHGTRILKMGDINANDRISNQNMERVLVNDVEIKKYRIYEGNVIFARTSMMTGGLGNCSIVMKHSDQIIFDGNLLCAEINTKIAHPTFYFYYFKSKYGQNEISKMTGGTQGRSIPASKLAEVFVPLPTKSEQIKIAKILFDLDSKIENLQNQNKILEKIPQYIFNSWFVDFDGITEFKDGKLGKIPKNWNEVFLSDCLKFVKGKKPKNVTMDPNDNSLPIILLDYFVGISCGYSNDKNLVTCNRQDILMVMDGSVGRIEIGFAGIVGSTLAKIELKENLPIFYFYFLLKRMGDRIKSSRTGSVISHVDKNMLLTTIIVLPNNDFSKRFEQISTNIFNKIFLNKKNISLLIAIRNGLLIKLISGKIQI